MLGAGRGVSRDGRDNYYNVIFFVKSFGQEGVVFIKSVRVLILIL